MANFIYVRQKGEPKGNARPVLNASHLIGDEPFFYMYPDDYFACNNTGSASQMLKAFEDNGSNSPILSLYKSDKKNISKYGTVDPGKELKNGVIEMKTIVEKPDPENAPSLLASVNGYLLTPDTIPYIEKLKPDKAGEISIPDTLKEYAKDHQVLGVEIEGKYFDCGNKVGYMEALIHAASHDPKTKHLV